MQALMPTLTKVAFYFECYVQSGLVSVMVIFLSHMSCCNLERLKTT